jgi:hypothetical protein
MIPRKGPAVKALYIEPPPEGYAMACGRAAWDASLCQPLIPRSPDPK